STAAGGFNSRPNMETSRFCRPTSGRIHPPWERLHDLARRLLARCGSGARAAARSRLGFDRQTLRAKVRWEGDFLIERLEISEAEGLLMGLAVRQSRLVERRRLARSGSLDAELERALRLGLRPRPLE